MLNFYVSKDELGFWTHSNVIGNWPWLRQMIKLSRLGWEMDQLICLPLDFCWGLGSDYTRWAGQFVSTSNIVGVALKQGDCSLYEPETDFEIFLNELWGGFEHWQLWVWMQPSQVPALKGSPHPFGGRVLPLSREWHLLK